MAGTGVGHIGAERALWRPSAMVRHAVVLFVLLDLADTLIYLPEAFTAPIVLLAVLSAAASITALRFPLLGVGLATVPIAATFAGLGHGSGVLPMAVTTVAVLVGCSRWVATGVVVAYASMIAAHSAVFPAGETTGGISLVFSGFLAMAVLIGLCGRALLRRSRTAAARIVSLEQRVVEVRREERVALAEELSGLLVAGLRANQHTLDGVASSTDPGEVVRTLSRIEAASRTALTRLRRLVSTLRSPADAAASGTGSLRLTEVVDDLEDLLVGHGYAMERAVSASVDALDADRTALLGRCLDEAAEHLREAAPAGATCSVRLAVHGPDVRLLVEHPTDEATSDPGAALRTLREDAVVRGGTLRTFVQDGRWTFDVTVPQPASPTAAVPTGPAPPRGWATWIRPGTGRVLITLPSLVGGVHFASEALASGASGDPSWTTEALWATTFLGLALSGWNPLVSAAIFGIGLLGGLAWAQPTMLVGQPPQALVMALTALATSRHPRWVAACVVGWAVYVVAWYREVPYGDIAFLLTYPLIGAIVGLAVHHYVRTRKTQLAELDRLAVAASTAREHERRQLAGELHDVVAHQLSLITTHVMAHGNSSDLDELHQAAGQVSQISHSAQSDLTTLVHVMRHPQGERASGLPEHEAGWVTPTRTAEAVAAGLADAGHTVELRIAPEADDSDPTTQRTLTRILREATTNILRYAPPASSCTIEVTASDATLEVLVTNPLRSTHVKHPLSTGWGLLGLTERASLTGGSFEAHAADGAWHVHATLPRGAAAAETIRPDAVASSPAPVR